ncbi:MAG: hypothetical protein OIF32_12875, partial [Campylobacterales bacterium]|nr:hypothetical protein [Campylobacterales bacterium]
MKHLFSFLLLISLLSGDNSFLIEDEKFLVDCSNSQTKESVITSKDLKPLKKYAFGYTKCSIWTVSTIKNNSSTSGEKVLKNPRNGIDFIDVYLYKDNQLHSSFKLGDNRRNTGREIKGFYSAFPITLKPNEKQTIVTKVSSYGPVNTQW